MELAPGFKAALPDSYASMRSYIESAMPPESTLMYGMHPNAELSLLASQVTSPPRETLKVTNLTFEQSSLRCLLRKGPGTDRICRLLVDGRMLNL